MAYFQRNITLYGLDWAFVFSIVMLLTWVTILGFYLISLIYGKRHLHKPRPDEDKEKCLELPGVTIAKPLASISDPQLHDNLSTYFTLNYPKYEIIFCIQDAASEELIKMINGLMVKYPSVDAKMVIGAQNIGVNPKVNNMINAYDQAQYPLFLISDAGITMKPDTLTDMVEHMTEKVGLVHQLPVMLDGDLPFSRVVEKVWFGGAHARCYLAANAAGVNCMTSMSCMFRKKVLDEEGGMKSLSCYLGEDFFLAQLLINKGWHVVLSSHPAAQNPGVTSLSAFRQRMMRWMYLRFAAMPQLILLEPLTEHVFMAPLAALAAQYIFHIPIYISLPAHIVCWCIMDYILAAVCEGKRPSYSIFTHMRAWVLREVLILYLWPNVVTMRFVSWGGKKFRVKWGGKTERINGDSHTSSLLNL